jgi:hypothetical protein
MARCTIELKTLGVEFFLMNRVSYWFSVDLRGGAEICF